MLVGIIGAMKVEVAELINNMEIERVDSFSSISFYHGKIKGYDVIIAQCGVGKVHAAMCTQTMILKFCPDLIINTGVAGSLSPLLDVGDCAIASGVVQYDLDTTAVGDPLGMISGLEVIEIDCDQRIVQKLVEVVSSMEGTKYEVGLFATGDRFLNSKEAKDQVSSGFKAIAVEMESGSIGQVCYINKVPFGIVRAISDNADNTSHIDYSDFLVKAASKAALIVEEFVEAVNNE